MEKCKFCQADLAENGKFCPVCGKNNAEEVAAEETAEVVTEAAEETVKETVTEEAAAEETASEETASEEAAEEKAEEEKAEEAAAPEIKEGTKATPGKIALAVVAVVALLGVLIALVMGGQNKADDTAADETAAVVETTEATVPATHPADGNPDDVTCKGTYSVSDEEAAANKDVVVATMGDKTLTNGQLQVFYWSMVNSFLGSEYGYYMVYYGAMDYTKPLDTQLSLEESGVTWQQYFLDEALNYWQLNQALTIEAEAAAMEMPQENRDYLDGLEASLAETAAYYNMADVNELLLHNVGPGAGFEEFRNFQELYYSGKPYYDAEVAKMVPTAEELEAYFAEHEEDYATAGVTKDGKNVDVRHILIKSVGENQDASTFTEEEWAQCEAKAQEILDAWLAGEATEDSFAALANEHSEDPGSNTNGGLYEGVTLGQMVEPFETWCFDEARVIGDTGLVKTSYGYHVMYFVGSTPIWESYAKSDWVSEKTNAMIEALTAKYPIEVDFGSITLGVVNLGG